MITAVLLLLSAAAVRGQEPDGEHARATEAWTSRFLVGRVINNDTVTIGADEGRATQLSGGDGVALLFDVSRTIGPRSRAARRQLTVALSAGFGLWTFPSSLTQSTSTISLNGFRATEYHVGVVFERATRRGFNFYGGPLLVANSKDIATTSNSIPSSVVVSSTVGPAAQFGIRLRTCRCNTISADVNVRVADLRPPVTGNVEFPVARWMLSAGIAIRH